MIELSYWGFAAIPVVCAIVAKFALRLDIDTIEFVGQLILGVVFALIVTLISYSTGTRDVEVVSGQVTAKERVRFPCYRDTMNPCRVSYSCPEIKTRIVTDHEGKIKTETYTEHHTCYVYPWEQDWHIKTTVGTFLSPRHDRRGAIEPQRYTITQIGDAAATTQTFKNYLLRARHSIYNGGDTKQYAAVLPKYPNQVYDLYHVDRAVNAGTTYNLKVWNEHLQSTNGRLGSVVEGNTVIVFTNADSGFAAALQSHWKGFKQNDAVMVIGIQDGKIAWSDVRSWSKEPRFDILTRNHLKTFHGRDFKTIDPKEILSPYEEIMRDSFVRRPMEDFEYLKREYSLSMWTTIFLSLMLIAMSVGMSVVFHNVDVMESLGNKKYRSRW